LIPVEFFIAHIEPNLKTYQDEPSKFSNTSGNPNIPQSREQLSPENLVDASKRHNLDRIAKKNILSDKDRSRMAKEYTRPAQITTPNLDNQEAEKMMDSLYTMYIIQQASTSSNMLFDLKEGMLELIKKARESAKTIDFSKINIKIINGFAGAGKTYYIKENFDPIRDAYIAPFADVCVDTYNELYKANGKTIKPCCKTFEKLAQIPSSGRILYIDEASAYAVEYFILVLLTKNYERIEIIGDQFQTRHFDVTGESSSKIFIDLVKDPRDVGFMFYTMRFGPKVAYLMNALLDYPVFSLSNDDTEICVHELSQLKNETKGTNICCNSTTEAYYSDFLQNIKTAKSLQGRTHEVVNIVGTDTDIEEFFQYKANGIVAFSRVSKSLNIYVDRYTKNRKNKADLLNFLHSYETTLGITLFDNQDF